MRKFACSASARMRLEDCSGSAAVEFAILAPIYTLLVAGMAAYGIYFGTAHSVQQIAADAARASVAGLEDDDRRAIAERYVQVNAVRYVLIDPQRISVVAGAAGGDATQFMVDVSYDASQLPIWGLLKGLPLPRQTIVRRSTIRTGGI